MKTKQRSNIQYKIFNMKQYFNIKQAIFNIKQKQKQQCNKFNKDFKIKKMMK